MLDITAPLARFVAAVNRGEPDAVERFVAADFFVHRPAPGEPTATEQWAVLAADVRRAFADLSVQLDDVVTEEGERSWNVTLRGTFSAPLWNAPPTGASVTLQMPIRARVIGDRVAINLDVPPPHIVALLRELDLVNPPDQMDRPQRHPVAWPDFVLQLAWTAQAAPKPCTHLADARVFASDATQCAACVMAGDTWPALRMCLVCGEVGCCDTAKNRHMKLHHEQTGHPIFRSLRLAEGWGWCYEDNAFFSQRVLEEIRSR